MSDFNLQEELLALSSDISSYTIPSELDIPSLPETEIDLHLSSAIDSVVNDPDSLSHSSPTTFDVFRSILKYADHPSVSAGVLTKLLDAIVSGLGHHSMAVMAIIQNQGFEADMDAPMVHRPPLEMWAFLLQWFVTAAQLIHGRSGDTVAPARGKGAKAKKAAASSAVATFRWQDYIPLVLATSQRCLQLPTSRLWRTSVEKEAFVSCFTRPAYQLCETESHLKSAEIRTGIYRVICLAVKFSGHAFGAQTTIVQNLTYFEHLSEPMAELLEMLEKEFDYGQLGEEVLRDVAAKTSFAKEDVKGPRSFSRFLVKMAEGGVRGVQKQMPLLLVQLDNEVSTTSYNSGCADSRPTRCEWPSSKSSVS
jgi:condensin complex subunit 1